VVKIYCFKCRKEANKDKIVNLECKECCKSYILLNYLDKLKNTDLIADRNTDGTGLIVRPR